MTAIAGNSENDSQVVEAAIQSPDTEFKQGTDDDADESSS